MTALTRLALAATASLALLAGCSAAPASTAAAPAAGAASAVEVSGFKFAPATLEVAKGTKVTWTNKDTTKHTVTSGKDGTKDSKFDGPLAEAPGTFSFTFAEAGTYAYFCSIHKSMVGTITVK
ncbi:MAG: hypothetical protein NVSMB8_13740 [Candidatus Limnocylindrales bacterium]